MEQTEFLAQKLLGKTAVLIEDVQSLRDGLSDGVNLVITVSDHQWVVDAVDDQRVTVYDPTAEGLEAGEPICDELPSRRFESEHKVSFSRHELERWMKNGELIVQQLG